MKKIISLFILIFCTVLFSNTTIDAGPVQGHWTIAGSPYLIEGSIYVEQDSTLIIDAGVEISFSDSTGFGVSGTLLALGTETDSIFFNADNDFWYGIQLENPIDFEYCSFSEIDGYGIMADSLTSFTNCTFEDITSEAAILASNGLIFENNVMRNVEGAGISALSQVTISNSEFENISSAAIYRNTQDSLIVRFSNFYNNSKALHNVGEHNGEIIIQNNTFINNNFCFFLNDATPFAENDFLVQNSLLTNNSIVTFANNYSPVFASSTIMNNSTISNVPITSYNSIIKGDADYTLAEFSCLSYIPENSIGTISDYVLFENPVEEIGPSDEAFFADWRCLENSPTIDMGNPDYNFEFNTALDLDSNERIFSENRIDIGAYEFQGNGEVTSVLIADINEIDFGFVQTDDEEFLMNQFIRIWNIGTMETLIDSIYISSPYKFKINDDFYGNLVTDLTIQPGTFFDIDLVLTNQEIGSFQDTLRFISSNPDVPQIPVNSTVVSENIIRGEFNSSFTINGEVLIDGNVYFNGGLTINAGSSVQMTSASQIFASDFLIALGTSEESIEFKAFPGSYYWKGLNIENAIFQMENITIKNVRNIDGRALQLNNVILGEIENLTISNCAGITSGQGDNATNNFQAIYLENSTLKAKNINIYDIHLAENVTNSVRGIVAQNSTIELISSYFRFNGTFADVAFGLYDSEMRIFNSIIDNVNFGARLYNSNIRMVNTILSAANYSVYYHSGQIRVYHCNVPNIEISIYQGSENPIDLIHENVIDASSDYVNIEENNFELLETSVNIDAGTPANWIIPWNNSETIEDYLSYDLEGNSYDIGIFEYVFPVENSPEISNKFYSVNYPNPFSFSNSRSRNLTIKFNLPKQSKVDISIYNVKGQKVKTIEDKSFDKGTHIINWNGKNSSNELVSNGVYFYRIKTENNSLIKKLMILK